MSADEVEVAQATNEKVRLYNEGVDLYKAGDFENAVEKFGEVVAMDPAFVPALVGMALVEEERGNLENAIGATKKALAVEPENYRALRVQYEAYRQLGDTENAEQAAKALRNAEDTEHAVERIFREGVAAFNDGDVEKAKACFRDVLDLNPELVEAYANLARIYLAGENLEAADTMAEEALKRRAGDVDMLKVRYDALSRQEKLEDSEVVLEELVIADPDWAGTGLLTHAANLFNAGQLVRARSALEAVLSAHQDLPDAHYLLGLCLNSSGEIEKAKNHFRRFVELAPDHEYAAEVREILSYLQ
jgi:tetratricopeptide (TPR) repeat protein